MIGNIGQPIFSSKKLNYGVYILELSSYQLEQAKIFKPRYVAVSKHEYYQPLKSALAWQNIQVASGAKAIIEAGEREVDLLMAAIVGSAGLLPTVAAIKKGTTVALANKQC